MLKILFQHSWNVNFLSDYHYFKYIPIRRKNCSKFSVSPVQFLAMRQQMVYGQLYYLCVTTSCSFLHYYITLFRLKIEESLTFWINLVFNNKIILNVYLIVTNFLKDFICNQNIKVSLLSYYFILKWYILMLVWNKFMSFWLQWRYSKTENPFYFKQRPVPSFTFCNRYKCVCVTNILLRID